MAKTWVLDTETKGTGASVVPIEKKLSRQRAESELELVDLGGPPRQPPAPAPREPARFKIVDVLSSRVLAEHVGARAAVEVLARARSVVDVRVYAWAPERRRWRLLSLEETKKLWAFRERLAQAR
jgi:hypothetical protein